MASLEWRHNLLNASGVGDFSAPKRENPNPGPLEVYGYDCTLRYLGRDGSQDVRNVLYCGVGQHIPRSQLHNTWTTRLRSRENGSEIEIARKHNRAMLTGPSENLRVRRVKRADVRPVLCLVPTRNQSAGPRWGEVDVDHDPHGDVRSTSRSSERHAA